MTNGITSPIDSIPVRTQMSEPTPQTQPTNSSTLEMDLPKQMEKHTYQGTRIQTLNCQTHHQTNLIYLRIAIPVNQLKRNTIRRKSVGNTRNITRQTHRTAILIRPTTVIIDPSKVKRRAIIK